MLMYTLASKAVKGFTKCFNFRSAFTDYHTRLSSVDRNVNAVCCALDFYFRNRSVRKAFANEFTNFKSSCRKSA